MSRQVILEQVFSSKMLPTSTAEDQSDAAPGCAPAATSLFPILEEQQEEDTQAISTKVAQCQVKLGFNSVDRSASPETQSDGPPGALCPAPACAIGQQLRGHCSAPEHTAQAPVDRMGCCAVRAQ